MVLKCCPSHPEAAPRTAPSAVAHPGAGRCSIPHFRKCGILSAAKGSWALGPTAAGATICRSPSARLPPAARRRRAVDGGSATLCEVCQERHAMRPSLVSGSGPGMWHTLQSVSPGRTRQQRCQRLDMPACSVRALVTVAPAPHTRARFASVCRTGPATGSDSAAPTTTKSL